MFRNAYLLAAIGAAVSLAACQQAPHSEAAAAGVNVPESITLVETVRKASSKDLTVPYKKFELDNGMTLILHEDDSDPLVHVDITYHVGSAREEVGKSGFAHFFEHMLFQGSENVADEEHFKIISESGGTLNGSTSSDRTNYYETVPSNQLEKVLWLEADRMGYFLDSVTQEKFEVQRETVKNERGQSVDNQPYGRLLERVGEALYPAGHGYSWSTIGYIEDLNRVDVNDLKRFFLRWYGPNNATLTIGGRFDEAETLAWVAKYFGPIPRGPAVDFPDKPEVALDADRYLSMEDHVALPLLYMAGPLFRFTTRTRRRWTC
jgi:zinc protease